MKTTGFSEDAAKWKEAQSLRRLAFFSISAATCSILVGILAVPALYGYLQRVQSVLEVETAYCKSATGTLWRQFAYAQASKGVVSAGVFERGSLDERGMFL